MNCRICGSAELEKFLSLGETPLANSFLSKEQLGIEEKKWPLELCLCHNCRLVQLSCVVPPEIMFKNYVYVTSTSNTFRTHFTNMAENISAEFGLGNGSLAVDIGSNDGLLLKGFRSKGIEVIGVEPATNISKIAEQDGIETINDFFNENTVNEIVRRKGHADVVTANNVFAHVNDIASFTNNVKNLMKNEGVFVIEVQYLINTLQDMTFDNIYHEHLSYYSLTSLEYFFKKLDMEIFKVQRVDSHGGSLRVFIKKKNSMRKIDSSVDESLSYEKEIGIEGAEVYRKFAEKVYRVKKRLVEVIINLKQSNKRIAGFGAPAKSTTLLNFCGIGGKFIEYTVDENALKHGLYTPGTHIPVVGFSTLDKEMPDYMVILAWNFADEIMKKTEKYSKQGMRCIIPLPSPKVV